VLGTNGKGSTAASIEAILLAAGMNTALFTSPHLISLQERLRINGGYAPAAEWRASWERVVRAVHDDSELSSERPSFFENITALSMSMMGDRAPDVAVIEAGLGGRYDATSACEPLATLINPIGMDHMEYLGPTLRDIASEKFAAVKSGVDAFYAGDDELLARDFTSHCEASGAIPHLLDRLARPVGVRLTLRGSTFSMLSYNNDNAAQILSTPLIGLHQAQNAVRVVTMLRLLRDMIPVFSAVTDRAISDGLARVDWPGRMEVLRPRPDGPEIILDGAHNEHGARALVAALVTLRDSERIKISAILFAVMKDKEISPILRALRELNCPIYCTQLDMARSSPADETARLAREEGFGAAEAIQSPALALERASAAVGPSGVILCCGSLYLVGRIRKFLKLPNPAKL
jgi:dihydrofolate synthase/folylpolyglutamate synthase